MTPSNSPVPGPVDLQKHSDLISRYLPPEHLLSAVDASIGIVICDRRLRYKALNDIAARAHDVPLEAHLGHRFDEILGNMAEKVAPLWEKVFASGQRISNMEVTGQLPRRSGAARWIENLFPLMDRRGRIARVACFVLDISSGPVSSSRATLLTGREQEVLRFVAEGKSNKEISSLLAISVRTVETYRARLMLKLQTPSIAHVVQYAIRNRIITL